MFERFYVIYILVGFKNIFMVINNIIMDLVGAFQVFPIRKLYSVNLHYIDILKLRTYD